MTEEMKNGVISEEALEQVAGGLNVSSSTLKKILISAGVVVTVAAGVTTLGAVGKKKGWFSKKNPGTKDDPTAIVIGKDPEDNY